MWLRQADKFVKDKSYEAALDAIAKARKLDPTNPYAIAYEERVRALMRTEKQNPSADGAKSDLRPEGAPVAAPHLEQISQLAMQQAQSTAAATALHQHNISLRKREEQDHKRQEETRKAALRSKLTAFIGRAQQLLAQEEFDRALDEISRALLLDPKNSDVLSIEKQIRITQDEVTRRREQEGSRLLEEEERKRQEQQEIELERIRREQQERKHKEEEARRLAQKQKIDQYLGRSRSLLAEGRPQEAQNELAFVVVIDPLNPEVLKLQEQIHSAQETQRLTELEHRRKKEEEERKKEEATRAAVQKHIENATKLAATGGFTEALRVVTLAYVLDPANEQIQDCENKILAAQEESLHRAGEERKVMEADRRRQGEEEHQRRHHVERQQHLDGSDAESAERKREDQEKCRLHLAKAREHLTRQQFEGALAEVALAFMIDPFSDDVKQMEQEVRTSQARHMQEHGDQDPIPPLTDTTATAQQIAEHVATANRLRQQHEYAKALDELAKAFILDPLDPSIQNCEEAIQAEFIQRKKPDHKADHQGPSSETPPPDERIARIQNFIARQSYDDALSEIALGLALKPDDTALRQLEASVWALKSGNNSGTGDSRIQKSMDKDRTERENLIRSHLQSAENLIAKKKFAKALDELAQAFVLDPLNTAAKKMEDRIRQQQSPATKDDQGS